MLKLITCIDKNNNNLWVNKSELIQLKNMLLNKVVLMDDTTYNELNEPLNSKIIIYSNDVNLKVDNAQVLNDFKLILEMAKTQDVFVIGNNEVFKKFEAFYDELIIAKMPAGFNDNTSLNINLNYFTLRETQTFPTYSIYYYNTNKNRILFGNVIASEIKKTYIKNKDELVAKYKKIPHLAIIQVGDEYASNVYINNKIKLLNELNLEHTLIKFDANASQDIIIKQIQKFNKDKKVNGILVQLPLPSTLNEQVILQEIDPLKDVDCFNSVNVGKLYTNPTEEDVLLPCTATGIIELLNNYKIDLESKNVVLIGRSNYVSKPLIPLLLAKNATVTVCHSKTQNLKEITTKADIVISAIGKANFFDKSYFNLNSTVIDVGINRDANNKAIGDVNFVETLRNVKYITPVPNGVGAMTTVSLIKNLLICYKKQFSK